MPGAVNFYNPVSDSWINSGGMVYDTDQIGTIKAWSSVTIPETWVLADGATYQAAQYPQAFAFALNEVAAGNLLWAVDTDINTFTVPDLTNQFLVGANGDKPIGTSGGEEEHALITDEMPSHSHLVTQTAHTHTIPALTGNYLNNGGAAAAGTNNPQNEGTAGSSTYYVTQPNNTGGSTISLTIDPNGSDAAHNNMPPYVAVGWIIKLAGVTIDSGGALKGEPGEGIVGPAGPSFDYTFTRVYVTTGFNLSAGSFAWTPIKYDTVSFDDGSNWDPVNFEYVCPEDGIYEASSIVGVDATAAGSGAGSAIVSSNGQNMRGSSVGSFVVNQALSLLAHCMIKAEAGDTIGVQAYSNATGVIQTGSPVTSLAVMRIA